MKVSSGKPYLEIARQLRERVYSGELAVNEKLRSQNELAIEFGVSQATVQKSLKELEREGLIWTQQGKGRFVAEVVPRQRSWTIGVVLFELDHLVHPVTAQRLAGLKNVLGPNGYHLAAFALNEHGNGPTRQDEDKWSGWLENIQADGLVIPAQEADLATLQGFPETLPSVWMDSPFRRENIANINLDYLGGGFAAANHLLELGHRDIAFMTPCPDTYRVASEQRRGIRLALPAGQLHEIIADDYSEAAGYRAGTALLAMNPRPTAVICAADEITQGLCTVCREQNIDLPNDLSVVGWNDTLSAEQTGMAMTSVQMPFKEAGEQAGSLLIDMLDDKPVSPGNLDSTLVVRDSTVAPCQPLKKRGQQRFTLLELLIVVAIIGVLAALLLPALSQARRIAKGTACLQDLRQVGLGMQLYADDNEECLPGYYWGTGNITETAATNDDGDLIRIGTHSDGNAMYPGASVQALLVSEAYLSTYLWCRDFTVQGVLEAVTPYKHLVRPQYCIAYDLARHTTCPLGGGGQDHSQRNSVQNVDYATTGGSLGHCTHLGRLRNHHGGEIMMGEKHLRRGNWPIGYNWGAPSSYHTNQVAFRHTGIKANFLFYDLHVKMWSIEQWKRNIALATNAMATP